jgi:hypothetical protein
MPFEQPGLFDQFEPNRPKPLVPLRVQPTKKPEPPKENPINRLPSKPAADLSRMLTSAERGMYKMKTGVWPRESMTLGEFRKFMGGLRNRGGFR